MPSNWLANSTIRLIVRVLAIASSPVLDGDRGSTTHRTVRDYTPSYYPVKRNPHACCPRRTWIAPPVVWAGIVGESGTLKSPAIKIALAPILKRQAEAMDEHRAATDRYTADMQVHRADGDPIEALPIMRNRHGHDAGQQVACADLKRDAATALWTGVAAGDERIEHVLVVVSQRPPRRNFPPWAEVLIAPLLVEDAQSGQLSGAR
jgi:hypothetical protein